MAVTSFRVLCVLTALLLTNSQASAQSVEEIVQRHEETIAELNCFKVQRRSRPTERPWGTEYDFAWTLERSGSAYKVTTIQPGTMTDIQGNNPVPGQYSEGHYDGSVWRRLSWPQEHDTAIRAARNNKQRVIPGDKAYLAGSISEGRKLHDNWPSVALMAPTDDTTLPDLMAKSTERTLTKQEDQLVIRCKYFESDVAITIEPARRYMISRVDITNDKKAYRYAEWVQAWTEVDGFFLPSQVERSSSMKVQNRVSEYSNWKLCDAASSPLELQFLPGSIVRSRDKTHIWGENDQPEVSFPLNDEAALVAYEKEVFAKYGRTPWDARKIAVAAIFVAAIVLLAIGYWIQRRKKTVTAEPIIPPFMS